MKQSLRVVNLKDRLPDEVLFSVLVYLPVKSLVRFRCVSNSWSCWFKSPQFISMHLERSKEIVLLKRCLELPPEESEKGAAAGEHVFSFRDPDSFDLVVSPDLPIRYLPVNMPYRHSVLLISLFGPCNGIICIKYGNTIVLCNPALHEFQLCPPLPFPLCTPSPEGYVALHNGSGFGFDPKTNSYKVVVMSEIEHVDEHYYDTCKRPPRRRVDLYDSRTDSWRQIDASKSRSTYNFSGSERFFNGAFHWHASGEGGGLPHPCNIVDPDMTDESFIFDEDEYDLHRESIGEILYLNLSTEVFGEFYFPYWLDGKRSYLMVLNECLAVARHAGFESDLIDDVGFESYTLDEPQLIDIWVMKEYGVSDSWTKQYIIGPYIIRWPFFCWQNEWLVAETKHGQLASCALHTNEMKTFQFHGIDESLHGILYKESLISVHELADLSHTCSSSAEKE